MDSFAPRIYEVCSVLRTPHNTQHIYQPEVDKTASIITAIFWIRVTDWLDYRLSRSIIYYHLQTNWMYGVISYSYSSTEDDYQTPHTLQMWSNAELWYSHLPSTALNPWRSWQRRIKELINCWSWRSFLTINAINVPSGHVFRPQGQCPLWSTPSILRILYSVNYQSVCLRPDDPFFLLTVPRDEAASWQADRHRHIALHTKYVLHRQAGQALDYGQQALGIYKRTMGF